MLLVFVINTNGMGYSFERQKSITIANGFQTILNEPGHKQSKIWADKSCKFYCRSMKSDQSKVSTLKSFEKVFLISFLKYIRGKQAP